MTTNRTFPLGDVLSVTTGRFLSSRGMGGIYEILNYMTGDNLFTHQLPRAMDECAPWLLRRYPHLSREALASELAELDSRLEKAQRWNGIPDRSNRPGSDRLRAGLDTVLQGWLAGLVPRFGTMLSVEPIPKDDHERIDPLTELETMVGPDRVIVCVVRPEEEDSKS
jgi:hypothetical protein